MVGVEVKCAYFDTKPRSSKSSPEKVGGIRKQIDWLLNMGLNRVALLDVIVNRPSDGIDSAAWLDAAGQAQISLQAMKGILRHRLPHNSPSGQFVWPVGPVIGGDESNRGAGGLLLIRQPLMNSGFGSKDRGILSNRKTLLGRIPRILEKMPVPRHFPMVFVDCRKCRRLDGLEDSACRPVQAETGAARP